MKDKAFLSVVLPILQLDSQTEQVIERIDVYLSTHFQHYELVLVNNGGDPALAERVKSRLPQLRGLLSVIRLTRRYPVDVAVLAGLDKSIGDFIFQLEGPYLDFPIEMFSTLLARAREGYDIVYASPERTNSFFSRTFYSLFNRLSYLDTTLQSVQLLLTSRRALATILSNQQRFRHAKAMLVMSGLSRSMVHYPSSQARRSTARSHAERIELAISLFIAYSPISLRVGSLMCALFSLMSLGGVVYAVASYFLRTQISSGWTSLMLFVSIAFSMLFFLLTLLGEYLRHILLEVRGAPLYLVDTYVSNSRGGAMQAPESSGTMSSPRLVA